jgi:hypothetical protein
MRSYLQVVARAISTIVGVVAGSQFAMLTVSITMITELDFFWKQLKKDSFVVPI